MTKKIFFSVSVVAAAVGVIALFGTRIQQAEERQPAAASVAQTQPQGIVQPKFAD